MRARARLKGDRGAEERGFRSIFRALGQEANRDKRAEFLLRESIGLEAGSPGRHQFFQRPSGLQNSFRQQRFPDESGAAH